MMISCWKPRISWSILLTQENRLFWRYAPFVLRIESHKESNERRVLWFIPQCLFATYALLLHKNIKSYKQKYCSCISYILLVIHCSPKQSQEIAYATRQYTLVSASLTLKQVLYLTCNTSWRNYICVYGAFQDMVLIDLDAESDLNSDECFGLELFEQSHDERIPMYRYICRSNALSDILIKVMLKYNFLCSGPGAWFSLLVFSVVTVII